MGLKEKEGFGSGPGFLVPGDEVTSLTIFARLYSDVIPNRVSANLMLKVGGVIYEEDGSIFNEATALVTDITVTTTPTLYSKVWSTNPNTTAKWLESQIDAVQIGVALRRPRAVGVGIETVCSQIYLSIAYDDGRTAVIKRPNAVGDVEGITFVFPAGADHYTTVDEVVADDLDRVQSVATPSYEYDLYHVENI